MLREHLVLRRDICAWDWHPCQNPVCFSSAGLFNQMARLFCLKRDKASTLPLVHMIHHRVSSASGDLSVHIHTCFLSFWPQRSLVFSSDGGSSSSSLWSHFVLLSVSLLADSLPDGAFHCSIASLTGDIKPLCSIWHVQWWLFHVTHGWCPSPRGWHAGKTTQGFCGNRFVLLLFDWLAIITSFCKPPPRWFATLWLNKSTLSNTVLLESRFIGKVRPQQSEILARMSARSWATWFHK